MPANKKPQIIIFDPDDFYHTTVELILDTWGIELTDKAHNLASSKQIIDKILKKKVKPDIAIVEAHMGKSEFDGDKIAAKLRELVPKIKILGFSTYETDKWADKQAIKSLKDNTSTLILALSDLTGLEYEISNVKEPSD